MLLLNSECDEDATGFTEMCMVFFSGNHFFGK